MCNVSVIITFYNKGKLLLNAIESVYSQVSTEDEIIIVNDCSTDELSKNTFQKVKEDYCKSVLFFDTPKNSGASFAKDFGIRHSKNEIIVLLDADDVLPLNAVENIKQKFNSDDIALVYGNYVKNDLEKGYMEIIDCAEISDNGALNPQKLAKNWILLGTSPFRKSIYFHIGGFDKLYPKTDDVDFQRRLIVNNYKCVCINDIIYTWNRSSHGNNSGHTAEESLFSLMRSFEFYFKYLSKISFVNFILRRTLKAIRIKLFT